MENKQMIHIVSEIVVLVGLTFYFNQKNRKLMSHIEDLAQKIEEQEDLLQKHEEIIKKMVVFINQQNQNSTPSVFVQKQPIKTKTKKVSVQEVHTSPPLTVRASPAKHIKPKVSFKSDIQPVKEDEDGDQDDHEEESDLDAELEEELKELEDEDEEVEEINITGLKKTS